MNDDIDDLNNKRLLAAAYKRLNSLKLQETIDPNNLDARPHAKQIEIMHDFGKILTQWVVAGNRAGKTAISCRILSYVFEENYNYLPNVSDEYKKRKNKLILIAGRTSKQLENVTWANIKAFLTHSDYREIRSGQQLQAVINKKNGNKIIFLSFESERAARERVQGLNLDLLAIDEMPSSAAFVSEAMSRVLTTKGMFIATFTPLVVSNAIKQMVENAALPHSKRYRLTLWDNPRNLIPEIKERIDAEFANLTREMYNTRVLGDWASSDLAVFPWRPELHDRPLPNDYHASWPHVCSVDPAPSSATGYCIFAQQPSTRLWFIIKSGYIRDMVNTQDTMRRVMEQYAGLNVVRHVCDTAAAHWILDAPSIMGVHYTCPYDKNNRRDIMISNTNIALGSTVLVVSGYNSLLIDEMMGCSWSESDPTKIVNSNKWHILDAMRYGIDCLPQTAEIPVTTPWYSQLREASMRERLLEGELGKSKSRFTTQRIKSKMRNNARNWRPLQ